MFNSTSTSLNWSVPQTLEEFNQLLNDNTQNLLVFKHSERCAVSRMALRQFEATYNLENVHLIFIEVRKNRDLSNYIAAKWEIEHQSPQVLLQNTKGNHKAMSHHNISMEAVHLFLENEK